jgi:branched-chain amino acid transport system substrate-binding protein
LHDHCKIQTSDRPSKINYGEKIMNRFFCKLSRILGCLLIGTGLAVPAALAQEAKSAAKEQFIPILSYYIGPYAEAGKSLFGGLIDYLDMVNKRDGGINGVKIAWEECETEYKVDLGVQCYEKYRDRATLMVPLSTGLTYALIERATADKVPLISMGHGRTDTSDGRVFPYVFPVITNYWSQTTAKIEFMGKLAGGTHKLKGKKIVNLHHGSAYGKETIPLLDTLSTKYGFDVVHIEVPHPGSEQDSQWQKIKEIKPDWVILRGWGVMNPVALKTAHKVGYPANRMIGNWWSSAEEDVVPAGEAAKGYISAAFHLAGTDFPVIKEILKHVYANGKKGAMQDATRVGTTLYNRGVIQGIIAVEAMRTAQRRFGNRVLTGEEVRWGYENLNINDNRIVQLGSFALMQPLKMSCSDHEGGGAVKFQRWSGKEWVAITSWFQSNQSIVRPMVEESAAKYAKEKNITPRDCAKEAAQSKSASLGK